ncbi:hypothetical protein ACGF12_09860 [Kitasatospora sp. NPDC048296]|uniref:hypothetical protein n=1 Tax=Kitasatospora sp. NPDC048296 TaxID=3364048 RepID=UPI0037103A55
MRSYTTKLTVAALAAATALSLAACGPDNSDPAATGGATGAAPAQTGAATGAASGGAAGGSTAAPSGAATGGAASGGAASGGAAAGGAAAGGAANGGAATGGAGTAGASGGGAGGGKLPQAGTSVKFGQPASIDFNDKTSNTAAKLQWTVTGIEPGSLKDFQDAKANTAGLDGRALFYVSWTMTNLGDTKLTFSDPSSKLKVYDAAGNTAMFANPVGSTPIAKCNTPSWSGATKGVAFKGCDIVSFPAGTTPVMIGYGDSTDITKVQAAWTK